MESSSIPEDHGILDLTLNLCNKLAKNNQDLASDLYKKAIAVMSTSSCSCMVISNPSEEAYCVERIRQHLSRESNQKLLQFELIYINLCNSSILKRRSSIINFFYYFIGDSSNMTIKNNVSKAFEMINTTPNSLVPSILSDPSNNTALSNNTNGIKHSSTSLLAVRRSHTSTKSLSRSTKSSSDSIRVSSSKSVTEQELFQDVIYMIQGFEGKHLRKEPGDLGFTIEPGVASTLSPTQSSLIERLMGIGFLHNQVKKYCSDNKRQGGFVCQALTVALNEELAEYYKTVAFLEAKGNKIDADEPNMTLRGILCFVYEHQFNLEWLAYIAEQCSNQKGGALISAIYSFKQHGSESARKISERMLKAACKPLHSMLLSWLSDGVINDPWDEFFIEEAPLVAPDMLWTNKYHVRQSMVPVFMSKSQASKVLAVGKSINFLRQICKDADEDYSAGRESFRSLFENTSADGLFYPEGRLIFRTALESIYNETSSRVLNVLIDKYKLYDHLQALRRYMLLEQGDFARHLLQQLAPELNKPANQLYLHTLTVILDSVIQSSNAQYEDRDILQRLIVNLTSPSNGDVGWDVFTLSYVVEGPISTVFQQTISKYQNLFAAFWRAKRTEFVLSNLRTRQVEMGKMFRKIKELKPVMHRIHCLTSKMVHFIYQTQYYFLEVLDSSWVEMQTQFKKATCLDDIISAHNNFLDSVRRGMLLTEDLRVIFSHLVSIYNSITELETRQETLYQAALNEKEAYEKYYRKANYEGSSLLTMDDQHAHRLRRTNFHHFLKTISAKIKVSTEMFNETVKRFLKYLLKTQNNNLMLFTVKLNFNNFF